MVAHDLELQVFSTRNGTAEHIFAVFVIEAVCFVFRIPIVEIADEGIDGTGVNFRAEAGFRVAVPCVDVAVFEIGLGRLHTVIAIHARENQVGVRPSALRGIIGRNAVDIVIHLGTRENPVAGLLFEVPARPRAILLLVFVKVERRVGQGMALRTVVDCPGRGRQYAGEHQPEQDKKISNFYFHVKVIWFFDK